MGQHEHAWEHTVVGNINLDISVVLDHYPPEDSHVFARESWMGLGGAASNYAVAAARLGHRSRLVAVAGEDAVKLGLLDALESAGVDTSNVRILERVSSGRVIVLIVPRNSSRTLITIRGANSMLSPEMVPTDGLGAIHFASVKPSIILEACDKCDYELVAYDPGGEIYRSSPAELARALARIGVLFMNDKELGEALRKMGLDSPLSLARSLAPPRLLIVKNGAGGATLYSLDMKVSVVPPANKAGHPVDVTGAGDAFDAAFNAWILEGHGIVDALRAAVAAGTLKVARKGSSNMPSRAEIEALIGNTRVIL
ncbi:MAG: PfkB family carbohydrate kinase [Desulfurococcales archaeon]|nr:PfkB family carbohydrate kinase [Desulfurococcales archaeon]